jgi:transketolase
MTADTFDAVRVRNVANQMRIDIIEMLAEAGSGHPGGSLSAADIVATLYFGGILRHDPSDPALPERDRFILSKGHAGPVLYAALVEAGYLGREHLKTLRKLGSILQGHPDSNKTPGVEVSTGSLGQGLSVACGVALGLRGGEDPAHPADRHVFCLLGDGECQEGQVWEAAMFAAHHSLDNLTAIVDENGLQIDGACNEVMCLGGLAGKFAAFGWDAHTVDGHDVEALANVLSLSRERLGRPVAIIARTVKGKGVSFMEDQAGWHGRTPTAEETARALEELASEGAA